MATQIDQGSSAPAFDARSWFTAWSDSGGIAMVVGEKLYLSRSPAIDREAQRRLDTIRHDILCDRERGRALASFLIQRGFGEVWL